MSAVRTIYKIDLLLRSPCLYSIDRQLSLLELFGNKLYINIEGNHFPKERLFMNTCISICEIKGFSIAEEKTIIQTKVLIFSGIKFNSYSMEVTLPKINC